MYLSVKDVNRLDAVVDHPDCPVERSHDVRGRLAVGTRQLSTLCSDSNQELKMKANKKTFKYSKRQATLKLCRKIKKSYLHS